MSDSWVRARVRSCPLPPLGPFLTTDPPTRPPLPPLHGLAVLLFWLVAIFYLVLPLFCGPVYLAALYLLITSLPLGINFTLPS